MFYKNFSDYLAEERKKLDERERMDFPDSGIILKVLAHPRQQTKRTHPKTYSVTQEVSQIDINTRGILGDRHFDSARDSTGRESEYPRKTVIAGGRHIFAVSPYDCRILGEKMGVEITPELLGANIVIGREDGKDLPLSELPITTRLFIAKSDSLVLPKLPTATLINYVKQQGCVVTGNAIAEKYDRKELSAMFIANSKDNRGIVCNIEYPVEVKAALKAGQKVFFRFNQGVSV